MAALAGTVGAFYASKLDALEMDISDDYVTVTDPTSGCLDFTTSQNFTVETWYYISDNSSGVLVTKGLGTGVGYELYVSDTNLAFGIFDGIDDAEAKSTSDVEVERWMHLVGVRDATNNLLKTFVNGVIDGSDTDDTGSTLANASDFIIGDRNSGSNPVQKVGMVRMWNKALSASQISDLHDGGFPVNSRNDVIGEWLFNSGKGSEAYDSSGQGNDGTIADGTWVTTTYDTATAENIGTGNGSLKVFNTAFPNVDDDNLTVTVDGTAKVLGDDFKMTPKGTVTFHTAPVSGAVVATYRHYPMTLEAGGFMNWSLDWTAEALDCTDFLSSGTREFIGGLRTWTATAERHWVNKQTGTMVPNRVIVKFFHAEQNDAYYNGWGIVTGIHPSVDVAGLVNETLDFQGTEFLGVEDSR